MAQNRFFKSLLAVGIALSMVVISASPASAVASVSGGALSCPSGQFTTLESNAKGRVSHQDGATVRGHWNNGTTYLWRSNTAVPNIPSWKIFITGSGGDISTGYAWCAW